MTKSKYKGSKPLGSREDTHDGEQLDEPIESQSQLENYRKKNSKPKWFATILSSLPLLHFIKSNRAITLGIIVAIAIAITSATYTVTTVVYKRQIEVLRGDRNHLRDVDQSLRDELRYANDNYNLLLTANVRPMPLRPGNGSTVIADQDGVVRFEWAAAQASTNNHYVIEIRNISHPNSPVVRFNVLKNKGRLMNIPLSRLDPVPNNATEYLWRVRAGKLLGKTIISQGPWSAYESFVVYPSITQRIVSTGTIRIGFSPSFFGFFNVSDFDGNEKYWGFDQDLGKWIATRIWGRLSPTSKKEIHIERIEQAFDKLLPAVRNFEVDLIISSITRTDQRERSNPGVKFSEGYLNVQQVFISAKKIKKDFPGALKKSRVGAQRKSVNYKSAVMLASQFDFEVVKFDYYADIYRELRSGEIDFGLVDNVLVGPDLGSKFTPYGPSLDKYFEPLYTNESGFESEAYAIAVRDKKLLATINRIIDSNEAKTYIDDLVKKWVRPPDQAGNLANP